jgi:hypothetical protein
MEKKSSDNLSVSFWMAPDSLRYLNDPIGNISPDHAATRSSFSIVDNHAIQGRWKVLNIMDHVPAMSKKRVGTYINRSYINRRSFCENFDLIERFRAVYWRSVSEEHLCFGFEYLSKLVLWYISVIWRWKLDILAELSYRIMVTRRQSKAETTEDDQG